MPIQTQNVTVQLLDAAGNPVVGATVTAKLDQTDYYSGGTITPTLLSQVTDATGTTIFNIWPNALGTMGSTYHFRAWAPGSNARLLDVFASVPARDCTLDSILDLTPVPINSWALAVDTNNGIVGKTAGQINFYDATHTELSYLVNHATAPRTYTFPDKSITVAGVDDIATMQTNVAITGGTIKNVALTLDSLDNTPVGANTPSTVKATTFTATGLATLQSRTLVNGATDDGGTALQVLGAGKFSDAVTTRLNLGLGSIATQAASAVALTGGTMDGTVIGGTAPTAITGTNITSKADNSNYILDTAAGTPGYAIELFNNGDTLRFTRSGVGYPLQLIGAGRVLVAGATDDGSTALQVLGSIYGSSLINAAQVIRAMGGTAPTTGAGLELSYSGGIGYIGAFDRGVGGGWKPLSLQEGATAASGAVLIGTAISNNYDMLQVVSTARIAQVTSGAMLSVSDTGTAGQTDASIFLRWMGTYGEINSFKNGSGAMPLVLQRLGGRALIGTTADNGVDVLQAAGSISSTGKYTITGGAWAVPAATTGALYANSIDGLTLTGNGTTHDLSFYSSSGAGPAIGVFHNSTRVCFGSGADDGITQVQAFGSGKFSGTLKVSGSGGGGSASFIQAIGSTNASMAWEASSAAADQKWWDTQIDVSNWALRAVNDANTTSNTVMLANRTGYAINYVKFPSGRIILGNITDDASTPVQTLGAVRHYADTYGYVSITPTTGNGGEAVISQTTTSPRNGGDLRINVDALNQGGNLKFSISGVEKGRLSLGGRWLFGTTVDNGADLIQASGAIYATGYKTGTTTWAAPAAGNGLYGANANYGAYLAGQGTSADSCLANRTGVAVIAVAPNAARAMIGSNPTDNGLDALQVGGSLICTQLKTTQTPTASTTASNYSVPIVLNGVTYYIRLSSTA